MKKKVDRNLLSDFFRKNDSPPEEIEKILRLTGLRPGAKDWRKFLEIFTLGLGSALCLAGVVFFFAYNWASMGKFLKLGIIELGILVTFAASWFKGLNNLPGKVSLLAAGVLVGVFMAVFGQVYQLGADSWRLYAGWSLLISAWVIVSKFSVHWALYIILINLSTGLYMRQSLFANVFYTAADEIILFFINLFFLVAGEIARKYWRWAEAEWLSRLVFLGALGSIFIPAWLFATGPGYRAFSNYTFVYSFVFYLLVISTAIYYFWRIRFDLFKLTAVYLSVIVLVTSYIGKNWFEEPSGFLLLGLMVVGLVAGAVKLLLWQRRVVQNA